MPPILSIVGTKNSGKTTLAERVVRALTSRGHRVATIKHDAHAFEVDHEGTDSWRLKRAGSVATILASKERVFSIQDVNDTPTIDDLCARYVGDVDLVLVEGFKSGRQPKIEVSRRETGRPLLDLGNTRVALAANYPVAADVPVFDLDDVEGIVGFIVREFLGESKSEPTSVELRVAGRPISMNPFVARIVRSTILGMIGALDRSDASPDRATPIEIRIR
ncbi:MAG: molybdopterin-guanine dinucleotide biosynthesis protein B [Myxococcales bacterium]|nr:molybdopterin-guanine dinucleotide biosynthesis protein B [Myxococcales bacterium]